MAPSDVDPITSFVLSFETSSNVSDSGELNGAVQFFKRIFYGEHGSLLVYSIPPECNMTVRSGTTVHLWPILRAASCKPRANLDTNDSDFNPETCFGAPPLEQALNPEQNDFGPRGFKKRDVAECYQLNMYVEI
jgi:hypothetical protein